ncbi:type II secretion system GspH family protein [Myxococcota bacterium]|nr:type II secretion system GspH family protein [Myxococcota bacterium]
MSENQVQASEQMDPRPAKKIFRRRQLGMTLIEIMVVIVIMGMVMGAVTVGVMSYLKKAKKKTTQTQVNRIAATINAESAEPENKGKDGKAMLETLISDGSFKKKDLSDAWGNEIRVEKVDRSFCVYSAGPDENFGTGDDIKDEDCGQ